MSARQRYVAESGGWMRLTCSEPDGSAAKRESRSKISGRSSRFFCQRMTGVGSPETSQRSRAVSPRYEETDSVGTTTFRGPGVRQDSLRVNIHIALILKLLVFPAWRHFFSLSCNRGKQTENSTQETAAQRTHNKSNSKSSNSGGSGS